MYSFVQTEFASRSHGDVNSGLQFMQQDESSISKRFKIVRGCGVVCGMLIVLTFKHKSSLKKKIHTQRILVWGVSLLFIMQLFHFIHWSTGAKKTPNTALANLSIEKQAWGFATQPETKEMFLHWELFYEVSSSLLILFVVISVDVWGYGIKFASMPLEFSKTCESGQILNLF